MAASTKLLGRIGSVLHGGKTGSSGLRHLVEQASEIPKGYALTSTGVLIPYSGGLKGFDLGVRKVEELLLSKMETSASLFYRFTKVIVGTSACAIALKLTWYEMTDDGGRLQKFLPTAGQPVPLGYKSKMAVIDEVNNSLVEKYNHRARAALPKGIPAVVLVQEMLHAEQRKVLQNLGFSEQDLIEAEIDLLALLNVATAELASIEAENPQDTKLPGPATPQGSESTSTQRSE